MLSRNANPNPENGKLEFDHSRMLPQPGGTTIPGTILEKKMQAIPKLTTTKSGVFMFRDDLLEFLIGGFFYDFLLDTFFDMSSNSASEMFSIRLLAER